MISSWAVCRVVDGNIGFDFGRATFLQPGGIGSRAFGQVFEVGGEDEFVQLQFGGEAGGVRAAFGGGVAGCNGDGFAVELAFHAALPRAFAVCPHAFEFGDKAGAGVAGGVFHCGGEFGGGHFPAAFCARPAGCRG